MDSERYGIDFLPTVALVRGGEIVARERGVVRAEDLAGW